MKHRLAGRDLSSPSGSNRDRSDAVRLKCAYPAERRLRAVAKKAALAVNRGVCLVHCDRSPWAGLWWVGNEAADFWTMLQNRLLLKTAFHFTTNSQSVSILQSLNQ